MSAPGQPYDDPATAEALNREALEGELDAPRPPETRTLSEETDQ